MPQVLIRADVAAITPTNEILTTRTGATSLTVSLSRLPLCRCVAVSLCLSAHNFLPGGTKTSNVGATSRLGKVYFEVFGKASDAVTFAFRTKGSSGSWSDFYFKSSRYSSATGKHTSSHGTCEWTPTFSAGDSASRVACVEALRLHFK